MSQLMQATACLRWSMLRFRHCDGQFRYISISCTAVPLFASQVALVSKLNYETFTHRTRVSKDFLPGLLGKFSDQDEGVLRGIRILKSKSNQVNFKAVCAHEGFGRSEGIGVDSDDEGEEDEEEYEAGNDYIVVNFYHFVEIEDPHDEVARHTAFVEGRNIRGRIYINQQGINAQFSGPREDAMAYAGWVKADERFSPTYLQISPSPRGHAFPRLKLRYKPSLVQVCESERLPLTDPSSRAVPLTPKQWREKLEKRSIEMQSRNDAQEPEDLKDVKKVLLLDVRNGYEWDVGHFEGAQRPEVECFKSTEFGLLDRNEAENDLLAGVDKENVDIMMYCTGGIRCDVYSTILRRKGFKNLYTLRGGVGKYLKEEGDSQWNGRLFVFDSRLSVPPSFYQNDVDATEDIITKERIRPMNSLVAKCLICGTAVEPVHRNCANLDCNNLYLSCPACITEFQGCCCKQCKEAPRLRPVLSSEETYQRWHNYRDPQPPPPRPLGWVSRRALKRRRRKERRREAELLKSSVVPEVHGLESSSSSVEETSILMHQL